MKISAFKTDCALEVNGVWKTILEENGKKTRVLVARDNNANFVSELRKEMAPYQTKIQRDNLTQDEADVILAKVMAKTILLDWENIQNDDDSLMPYSVDNAFNLLMIKDFRLMIIAMSSEMDSYRTQKISEVKVELKKPLPGIQNTVQN